MAAADIKYRHVSIIDLLSQAAIDVFEQMSIYGHEQEDVHLGTVNKSVLRIRKALVKLLARQSFDTIQVKHLVEEAGVARATFYLHFSSKEEVLIDYIDNMFDEYFAQIEDALTHTNTIDEVVAAQMFETFQSDADFSKVILQDTIQPLLLKRFKGYLSRIVGHVTLNNRQFAVPSGQLSFLIDYWAGGSLLLIQRWIAEGFEPRVDEMARLYTQLTISGMKALLEE